MAKDIDPETAAALDRAESDAARLLAAVKLHQEALWAILCHGRVIVNTGKTLDGETYRVAHIYLPASVDDLDVQEWWRAQERSCSFALDHALHTAFPDDDHLSHTVDWIMPVPDELADFAAKHSTRQFPSRFFSTAVDYVERDGIARLTAPEVVIYDRLKAAGWTFIPQPAVVISEDQWLSPDFLIFWGGRVDQAVFVEVDSDLFHSKPSVRERDEAKERFFEAAGFGYLRFAAKSCLNEPLEVIGEIQKFCVKRWGPSR
jgi:hypothetical protein